MCNGFDTVCHPITHQRKNHKMINSNRFGMYHSFQFSSIISLWSYTQILNGNVASIEGIKEINKPNKANEQTDRIKYKNEMTLSQLIQVFNLNNTSKY